MWCFFHFCFERESTRKVWISLKISQFYITFLIGTPVLINRGPPNLTAVRIVMFDLILNGLEITTSVLMFVVKKRNEKPAVFAAIQFSVTTGNDICPSVVTNVLSVTTFLPLIRLGWFRKCHFKNFTILYHVILRLIAYYELIVYSTSS